MLRWLSKEPTGVPETFDNVIDGLKKTYRNSLLPLEEAYSFHDFHSPRLEDGDFDAKPMIMLVGQYSTGKTTFIRYLLERDFPGMRVGPEPTTDSFTVVCHGDKDGVIMGNALVVEPKKQYRPLSKYGNAFLNRFQACMLDSPVLRGITIVDTPGILSGEKQRVDRGYDFTGVLEWFAERVDRIILMFDAHKLDISDEFRRAIEAFRGHDDKIRIVLNKADMVDHQQLMRVYGALMWALGKVLQTPEVARVYIGSFWDRPHPHELNTRLFEDEEQDLFRDLQSLPRNATLRKLNDLIKRARLAKVHAYIISSLRKDMPSMFGKDGKKKELIKGLSTIYEQLQREHQISPGDFPEIKKMQDCLANHDFTKFNPLKPRLLEIVDKMLAEDISRLMAQIPHEDVIQAPSNLHGGAFDGVEDQSPFGYKKGEGIDAGHGEPEWIVGKMKFDYDTKFEALGPINGKVSGEAAKSEMVKSKLPKPVLGKIWKLADIDKDGFLDCDEFALAMHLIKVKLDGHDLPPNLPDHLIPPSKRQSTLSAFTVRKPPMTPVKQPTPVEGPRTPVKKRVAIPPVKMDSTRIDGGSRNKESLTKVENSSPEDKDGSFSVENGLPQKEYRLTQVNYDVSRSNGSSVQDNDSLSQDDECLTQDVNGVTKVNGGLPRDDEDSPQVNGGLPQVKEELTIHKPPEPPKRTVVLKHKVLPEGGLRSYFETCPE